MGWTRIDDEFPWHPKVRRAGPLAIALHVMALCHCNRYLTDGLVDVVILRSLLDLPRGQHRQIAERLVEADLWEREGDHYRIHDFLKYNPSRSQVEAKRAEDSARKRTGIQPESSQNPKVPARKRTGIQPESSQNPKVPAPAIPSRTRTRPKPNRSPSDEGSPLDAPAGARKKATTIPENYNITDEVVAWASSELDPPLTETEVLREAEKWHDYHTAKGTTARSWPHSLRTWMRNASDIKGGRSPFGSKSRRNGRTPATSRTTQEITKSWS